MKVIHTLFIVFAVFMPAHLCAQDNVDTADTAQKTPAPLAYTYDNDACEFTLNLPEAPEALNQCEGEGETQKCFDKMVYNYVPDMQSSIKVNVICSPIDETVRQNYSADIMEKTLYAMTDRDVVKNISTSSEEKDGFKHAGLVGEGQIGKMPTIYVAQLWVGDTSAMSVETQLIGEQNPKTDMLFSQILKSIGKK